MFKYYFICLHNILYIIPLSYQGLQSTRITQFSKHSSHHRFGDIPKVAGKFYQI